ncbi:hypothetical protein SUGI_0720660 [Cryptomeria japonica]|uniref:TMV resistance protein N n=1 Tax=Cryptomeria japonica TaxID=3369 RepID=UPI00241478EA|nr:TMV resistance protein N [Cryptomeria japonica]GLJ35919.1 hypothetical protein SUGI_0720660 [Cryptomeria japonica]
MGNTLSCCACISSSNYEENAVMLPPVVDLSHLDQVISFIETRLNAIDKSEESTSNVEATTTSPVVDSSIKYGYILLENVIKRAHKHASKILSGETRKAVIDILKGIAQINWVVAGLGVVAYVLDQMDKISTNKNECAQFLRYMCGLAKQIKQLDNHLNQEKLTDVVVFIVNGSLFCISRMQSNNLSRFFSVSMDAEELKGLQSQLAHTYPDLTLDAVIQILNRIPITLPPTQGAVPNAVGIDEARAKVIKLLDLEDQSNTRGVVLYGVGGIGKTTLATAVFTSLKLDAYKHCRMNIQQDCSESDLRQLQEQVLSDLFAQKIQPRNCVEGKELLSRLLRERASRRVFLFMDNALRGSDLAKLLPEDLSCLPNGSRILITTRKLNETDMVEEGGVKRYAYSVNYLSDAASKKLLCLKALGSADKDFGKSLDIDGLVKLCGGVPLVLEMVGSKLRNLGNDVRACESTTDFLKDTLVKGEGDLSEKLVDAVYNTLENDVYKDAFLDIAAFFNKWSQQSVSCIVGDVALRAIEDAALVRISEEEKVIVHDIIQARGRKLSEGDRITGHQSIQRVLQDTQRLEKLKGIWVPDCPELWSQPSTDDFDGFQLQPNHLELLKSLRFLHFQHCSELKRLPESFGTLSALKMLTLLGSKLNCLPESFGLLSRLEELDIQECECLEGLPQSFSQLSRLKKLNISFCRKLSRLPDGFGQLKSLTYLSMGFCDNLEIVYDDFGELSSLCAVSAFSCPRLDGKAIDKLVEMKSLMFLNIEFSPMLTRRWKEVKARHPLLVYGGAFLHVDFEHAVSSALFDRQSRFLHNDGDLYFAEWSPGQEQEVPIVLSICDLCCASNRAALERVKQKIADLALEGLDIVYVSMGQNMEGIRQSLLHLPFGSRALITADEKSKKLLGYSICELISYMQSIRDHTLIARAVVSLDEKGEKYVCHFQLVSTDVEEFTDIAGGFSRFFFPVKQMERFVRNN